MVWCDGVGGTYPVGGTGCMGGVCMEGVGDVKGHWKVAGALLGCERPCHVS